MRVLGKLSPKKQDRNEGGFENYPPQISLWGDPFKISTSINNEGELGRPYKPVNKVVEGILNHRRDGSVDWEEVEHAFLWSSVRFP